MVNSFNLLGLLHVNKKRILKRGKLKKDYLVKFGKGNYNINDIIFTYLFIYFYQFCNSTWVEVCESKCKNSKKMGVTVRVRERERERERGIFIFYFLFFKEREEQLVLGGFAPGLPLSLGVPFPLCIQFSFEPKFPWA